MSENRRGLIAASGILETRGPVRKFFRRRQSLVALCSLLVLLVVSLVGPYVLPASPRKVQLRRRLEAPSSEHWLGTDELGRDVLVRTLYGIRLSIGIGLLGTGVGASIGVILGAIAGYFGGWLDLLLMRILDMLLSVPTIILVLFLASLRGPSEWVVIMAMAIGGWCWTARITRGEFLRLRRAEFVEAARALGADDQRIIARHILPNGLSPIIVDTTQEVGFVILLESSVSYLGLGVQPPRASLGSMLFQAQTYLLIAPWIAIVPGILILIVVLAFMVLGDAIRDALEPI